MGRAGGHEHRASHGRNNSMPFMNGGTGDVVLVTGGCGFLGKHLLRILPVQGDNISEIRVLDIQPQPAEFIDWEHSAKVKFILGDITDMQSIRDAFEGVNVVIHTASFIDTSNLPDDAKMENVNVKGEMDITRGTANVIDLCIANSIPYLIYTATSEMNRTSDPRIGATEDVIDAQSKTCSSTHIISGYSSTKWTAERMVLAANNQPLSNGQYLRTVSLRPCGIYGEGDKLYVTTVLRCGRQCFGYLPCLGSPKTRMQRVYVGNVAWAHVCALNAIRMPASDINGKSFIILDNTPATNNFLWMKPFLESQQIKLLPFSIPLIILFYVWVFLEMVALLLQPLKKIRLVTGKNELLLCCTTCTYNDTRAYEELGYKPMYSQKESFQRSFAYYSKLKI